MAYLIIPGCTGPTGETLALAADENGAITVQDAAEPTSGLWWQLIYDDVSEGFAMVNLLSIESGAPSVLGLATSGASGALTLSPLVGGLSPQTTWDVAPGGSALAVRPTLSSSFNLNVAGKGPYGPGSPVIAYDGWSNGAPNEIWTFQADGIGGYPWNYAFSPESAQQGFLTADPLDPGGPLTIQAPQGGDFAAGASQLWAGTYVIQGTVPVGVVFINEELGQVMRTTPGGGYVFCVDSDAIDDWSAWLTGPGPDSGMSAIRSVGNQNLYLNVSGGGDFTVGTVITYPWQGGATNEQWVMTSVPHLVT